MGWLSDFFRLKLPPLPDAEPDWMPGDRAECINLGGWFNVAGNTPAPGPDYRAVLRVTTVLMIEGQPFLKFDGWAGYQFAAGYFRKIRPASDTSWLKKVRGRSRRDLVLV